MSATRFVATLRSCEPCKVVNRCLLDIGKELPLVIFFIRKIKKVEETDVIDTDINYDIFKIS